MGSRVNICRTQPAIPVGRGRDASLAGQNSAPPLSSGMETTSWEKLTKLTREGILSIPISEIPLTDDVKNQKMGYLVSLQWTGQLPKWNLDLEYKSSFTAAVVPLEGLKQKHICKQSFLKTNESSERIS